MAPWRKLNFNGKLLAFACIVNVIVSIYLAKQGETFAIFTILMGAWCGLWTYNSRYQHQDAKDINEDRQE